jgi:hypothetical protein
MKVTYEFRDMATHSNSGHFHPFKRYLVTNFITLLALFYVSQAVSFLKMLNQIYYYFNIRD